MSAAQASMHAAFTTDARPWDGKPQAYECALYAARLMT